MSQPAHPLPELSIRLLADAADEAFVLAQVDRFTSFPLPPWRHPKLCRTGIRQALEQHLQAPRPAHYLFVAEDPAAQRVGWLRLELGRDYFSNQRSCHICELAVAAQYEGQGIGRALLAYAEQWARDHGCRSMSLAVFPDNQRALALYQAAGYRLDQLKLIRPLN